MQSRGSLFDWFRNASNLAYNEFTYCAKVNEQIMTKAKKIAVPSELP